MSVFFSALRGRHDCSQDVAAPRSPGGDYRVLQSGSGGWAREMFLPLCTLVCTQHGHRGAKPDSKQELNAGLGLGRSGIASPPAG